ncbi:MAG: M56 family metallopeptidase, partial [Verrucomicrobiota bacterium]
MNSPLWLALPAGMMILLKWTVLLALGWMMHGPLREHHARWRLILWRSILSFALLLPVLHFRPLFKIPAQEASSAAPPPAQLFESTPAVNSDTPGRDNPSSSSVSKKSTEALTLQNNVVGSSEGKTSCKPLSWKSILAAIWALGFFYGTIRLVRLHFELSRLRREAADASPCLHEQLRTVQTKLGFQRKVGIQISDSISSPFVCGLLQPTILLPGKLANDLSPSEISALLSHEIAHLRENDLVWCIGWRWMKAIFWFHPLIWQIPAAHNLACEQEADRIASGALKDPGFYTQLLAQLALRVVALRRAEVSLTLNGASQIARRLRLLSRGPRSTWNLKHSLAAFGMAVALLLVSAGWGFSRINAAETKKTAAVKFKQVLVLVQDESGKAVEGATIEPYALRVKGPRWVDHYGWSTELYGDRPRVTTDKEGKALVKYPVVALPAEKLLTGLISFTLAHPDFTPSTGDARVNESNQPVRLTHGIPLEVSGYVGKNHEPVAEVFALLGGEPGPKAKDWQKKENGGLAYNQLSPGGHMVQLMGKAPSGEIVYSEAVAFTAEHGKLCKLALEMKPGIRLVGRLDDNVPRPVKNGRAIICVRPKEYPATAVPEDLGALHEKYG